MLNETSEELIVDAGYDKMECHDPSRYRKKIKGFVLPFHIKERDLSRRSEVKKGRDTRNKLHSFGQREKQTLSSQAETLGEEQHSFGLNNLATVSIEDVAEQRARGTEQKVAVGKGKKSQVTMHGLGQLSYEDLNENLEDDFNPTEFLGNIDEAEYEDEVFEKFKPKKPQFAESPQNTAPDEAA